MLSVARTIAWILVAASLLVAVALLFTRSGGDAATRGLGRGLATLVGALGVAAALILIWEGRGAGSFAALVGAGVLALVPLAGLLLFVVPGGLAILYPSRRNCTPSGPIARYAFPDATTREAALALLMQDYARAEELLKTGKVDVHAHDERGTTLLGIAVRNCLTPGTTMADLAGVRMLLAAGTKPRSDDLDTADSGFTLFTRLITVSDPRATAALQLLLEAGLAPEFTDRDGRSTLFLSRLSADGARLLLERGIDRHARDPQPERRDWSAVTFHVDEGNWATALLLLEAGVPPDHATPPGAVLQQVFDDMQGSLSGLVLADPTYQQLCAASAKACGAAPR